MIVCCPRCARVSGVPSRTSFVGEFSWPHAASREFLPFH